MTGLPRKLELITILRDIYALEQKISESCPCVSVYLYSFALGAVHRQRHFKKGGRGPKNGMKSTGLKKDGKGRGVAKLSKLEMKTSYMDGPLAKHTGGGADGLDDPND